MTNTIIRCGKCGNFERLTNVYCRICGNKLPNKKREKLEIILPWFVMVIGIVLSIIIGFSKNKDSSAIFILCSSLLFILFSHKVVRIIDKQMWYEEPIYSRLLPIDGASKKENDNLAKRYNDWLQVSIFDRNIGLIINTADDLLKDDGFRIGQLKKAIHYYEANKEELTHFLGNEQYNSRVELFNGLVKTIAENTIMTKTTIIKNEYDEIVEKMIGEIENKEAWLEVEKALEK